MEYDFLAGKLDEEDYRSLKSELTAEALAALEADEAARGSGGQAVESEIDLRDGAAEVESADPSQQLRGEVLRGDQIDEGAMGIRAREYHPRLDDRTPPE